MPRPAYIIGAQTIIEDRDTSLVSAVTIIEKFTITVLQPAEASPVPQSEAAQVLTPAPTNQPWAVMAGWMKESGDGGIEFEHQWAVNLGADGSLNDMPIVPFSFPDGTFTQNRFRLTLPGMPPIATAGLAIVESRVRKVGETDWKVQQFPVAVEVVGDDAEKLLRDLKIAYRPSPSPRTMPQQP